MFLCQSFNAAKVGKMSCEEALKWQNKGGLANVWGKKIVKMKAVAENELSFILLNFNWSQSIADKKWVDAKFRKKRINVVVKKETRFHI